MIRTLALAGAAALMVSAAVPALAQSHPGPPPSAPRAPARPSDMFGGPRTQHFITAAAQTDEFERQAGRMAQQRAVSARVRDFGSMMVTDHTKTTQDLQAAIRRTGHVPPPPPQITGEQRRMLDQLRASGPGFDSTYLQQQVTVHQQALGLMQDYARTGHNAILQDAARQTIPVVQHHLAMAQQLQATVRR